MYVWLVMSFNPYAYKPSMMDVPSVHSSPEKAFQAIKELVDMNENWILEENSPPDPNKAYSSDCYVCNDEIKIWIARVTIDGDSDE